MTRSRTALLLGVGIGGVTLTALIAAGAFAPESGSRPLPAAYSSPAPETAPSDAPPAPNGLDFTGLTQGQTSTITQILEENRCNCGCGMTLLECRAKDPNCPRSLPLGRQVVQDVRAGKERAVVQSNLVASLTRMAAPPPAEVFKIDTNGAPFKGPKSAPVTIVEFSDYQ